MTRTSGMPNVKWATQMSLYSSPPFATSSVKLSSRQNLQTWRESCSFPLVHMDNEMFQCTSRAFGLDLMVIVWVTDLRSSYFSHWISLTSGWKNLWRPSTIDHYSSSSPFWLWFVPTSTEKLWYNSSLDLEHLQELQADQTSTSGWKYLSVGSSKSIFFSLCLLCICKFIVKQVNEISYKLMSIPLLVSGKLVSQYIH